MIVVVEFADVDANGEMAGCRIVHDRLECPVAIHQARLESAVAIAEENRHGPVAALRVIPALISGNNVREAVAVDITGCNALGTAAYRIIDCGLERAVSIA